MKLFSPQDCLGMWMTQKPVRNGKVLWASICKCIEDACNADETARTLSRIKSDIATHDAEIRADERQKTLDEVISLLYNKLFDGPDESLTTAQKRTNAILGLCIKQISELRGKTEGSVNNGR